MLATPHKQLSPTFSASRTIMQFINVMTYDCNDIYVERNRTHLRTAAPLVAKIEKQIAQIVEAIADGMYHPSMKNKMTGLEARKQELTALLAEAPRDVPDLLPRASAVYAKKIARLIEALNQPE